MDEDQLLERLPELVRTRWRQHVVAVEPLAGGMNSITALVTTDDQRWVAKWVSAGGEFGFRNGAEIAARLAAAGMRSGRPLPTVDSELITPVEDGLLALLEFVPGRELTSHVADQPQLAEALGRAHTVLGTSRRSADFFTWLGAESQIATIADWVLPAIEAVAAEYQALPPVTWGTLHTDPAPEAFLLDEATGDVGIIDWAGACHGPLLYDIASAVMYLGDTHTAATFLSRYADCGPVPDAELRDHLQTFRRFRAIVQADYFSLRILSNDLTGIGSSAENDRGLDHAQHMLQDLGVL